MLVLALLFAAVLSMPVMEDRLILSRNEVSASDVVNSVMERSKSVGDDPEDYQCPGSDALVHASCEVTVTVTADCGTADVEMRARVNAQGSGKWVDPHNNGTYSYPGSEANTSTLGLKRLTGNGKYTDKMVFSYFKQGTACKIKACSESQVTSVYDFSTNYCNLYNMYCGSKEGCQRVLADWDIIETEVKPSLGTVAQKSECFK